MLTHVDLFSGIGGFALAARWAGFKTVCFVEIEPYCQKVLKKHWPAVPVYDDIKKFKWAMADNSSGRCSRRNISTRSRAKGEGAPNVSRRRPITLITSGFPCQPFSCSGNRRGAEDDRFLWPEMVRIISEIRPTWVVAENVSGFINMELDRAISDLESEDYETESYHIPACAVAAPHERLRIFLMGYSKRLGLSRFDRRRTGTIIADGCSDASNPKRKRFRHGNNADAEIFVDGKKAREAGSPICSRQWAEWSTEPAVDRVAYGVPNRVDRLKALGNAIVPPVAYEICKAIAEIEGRR